MEHPFSDSPLAFGQLALCQKDYREFACSLETYEWLADGGMTHLDEVPVRLQLMDTLVGGFNVMVKIIPQQWADDLKWVQPADRAAAV